MGAERPSATRPLARRPSTTHPSATRPSYYTRGALKTGGGCRASITHAWSRRVDASTAPFFFLSFFLLLLDTSCNLSKFVSVLLSASVERVGVSRMRFFSFFSFLLSKDKLRNLFKFV